MHCLHITHNERTINKEHTHMHTYTQQTQETRTHVVSFSDPSRAKRGGRVWAQSDAVGSWNETSTHARTHSAHVGTHSMTHTHSPLGPMMASISPFSALPDTSQRIRLSCMSTLTPLKLSVGKVAAIRSWMDRNVQHCDTVCIVLVEHLGPWRVSHWSVRAQKSVARWHNQAAIVITSCPMMQCSGAIQTPNESTSYVSRIIIIVIHVLD